MVLVLLVLAAVFAGVQAWREKSFGWVAIMLLAAAAAWPQLSALK